MHALTKYVMQSCIWLFEELGSCLAASPRAKCFIRGDIVQMRPRRGRHFRRTAPTFLIKERESADFLNLTLM